DPEPEHSEAGSEALLPPEEDPWLGDEGSVPNAPETKTWEKFDQGAQNPLSPVFITEAGPIAFDAWLASGRASSPTESDVLDDASYCACLFTLALGRSSLLFSWDSEKRSFVKTVARLRTSGLSLELIECIDRLCLDCANSIKRLQSFADRAYSAASTPARVALARVVDGLVLALQSEISSRNHGVRSILQLQAIVQPVQSVLSYFRDLVGKLARQKSDEAMLSCLFQEAQSAEYRSVLLREATREVLRLVSQPWVDFVQEWLGFEAERGLVITKKGPGKGFVKVADRMWIDDQAYELEEPDFFLDEEKMPSFVPQDIAQALFETGRNLRFLREHHPEHPLSRQSVVALAKPPEIEWQFDWDSIKRLETKISDYQDALSHAIQGTLLEAEPDAPLPSSWSSGEPAYKFQFLGRSEAEIAANILASINQLNQPPKAVLKTDALTVLFQTRLYQKGEQQAEDNKRLPPHWSLVPLLSFGPAVDVQSRLVNQECMRLLFSSHDLRVHIDLLRQYFLMGNGILCSRLSHSLFDPDLETAERKAGVALLGESMGLRLGGRDSWPPASSELRLALMGVLSDSYESPSSRGAPMGCSRPVSASRSYSSDLPGDLSFAVRDLSPKEIDRCMDPDSIEALDFLQLSYKPPSPLRPIMTPVVLLKYDRIFKLLLRVLRMLYVVNQLFRDVPSGRSSRRRGTPQPSNASARFCIEARHFVRQIAAYFFDTGIAAPWRRFEDWLDTAEAEALGANSSNDTTNNDDGDLRLAEEKPNICSPGLLRDRQEQLLDDIMVGLMLRKRQLPVLKLLEETFTIILRFAKQVRTGAQAQTVENKLADKDAGETPEKLYAAFKKNVEVFITVCRGLGEKSATAAPTGKSSGDAYFMGSDGRRGPSPPESSIEQLLLRLDISGFYAKKA
ncbi:Spc98 family-domain-containing protein, partial [Lasiosphaeria miniovina]